MRIREERPADYESIHRLTELAFKSMAYSDGTEPDIIDRLRASGELTLSLVATDVKNIVGHVAFSPVVAGEFDEGWFGLGPISVHPDVQRTGIGSSLVNHGLSLLRERSCEGCVLVGDPKYYSRFGFISDGNVHCEGYPDEHVQWIGFGNLKLAGEIVFNPAFRG